MLQVAVSLVFLIPTFINVRRITSLPSNSEQLEDKYSNKAFKVSGECVMFIGYELWRMWLAIYGVSPLNIRDFNGIFFNVYLGWFRCPDNAIELENNLRICMFHYSFISI